MKSDHLFSLLNRIRIPDFKSFNNMTNHLIQIFITHTYYTDHWQLHLMREAWTIRQEIEEKQTLPISELQWPSGASLPTERRDEQQLASSPPDQASCAGL
jgi:hypothetical protein